MVAGSERVRVHGYDTLSDDWYVLRKYRFGYRRADGSWQELTREAYDRGNGAAILLYDPARRSVFLTRQFRLPAFVNGHADGMLLEAPAGLLDRDAPAAAIRREVEEETGFRLRHIEEVFAAYMSPGSVTERLHFFVAEVSLADRIAAGGGDAGEVLHDVGCQARRQIGDPAGIVGDGAEDVSTEADGVLEGMEALEHHERRIAALGGEQLAAQCSLSRGWVPRAMKRASVLSTSQIQPCSASWCLR